MNRNPQWLDYMDPDYVPAPIPGDPYFPDLLPLAPADLSEAEEDPSEDEEDPSENEESDNEGIFEDAQRDDENPDESLTDEDIATPPLSPPRPSLPPYQSRGKCPILLRAARKTVFPMSSLDIFRFTTQPKGSLVGEPTHEQGESSQAPPTNSQTPPDGSLANQVRSVEELQRAADFAAWTVERRVKRLEEEEEEDSKAIQILYHRAGASRTETNTMGVQIRALEFRVRVAETRLDAAEHRARVAEQEQLQLQEQHNELISYLATRFGS